MGTLESHAQHLVANSVTASSQRTYQPGITSYRQLCAANRWEETPATEERLTLFVAHLSLTGLSARTARVYIAGVRYLHLLRKADITAFAGKRLAAAIQGYQRTEVAPARKRKPITLAQLQALKHRITAARCLGHNDRQMLWAAVSLAYFGLLRVSEYTSPSSQSFIPGRTLTRHRVEIRRNAVDLRIPESKTDQHRRGATVVIGATGTELCPVAAVNSYRALTTWTDEASPFFKFQDGKYLTAADVNFWLQRLVFLNTTSHCLRIGGTTTAAEAGASTWQLQAGGRWRSDAYRQYIRPSRAAMGRLARLMTS